jgi:hypothetical protein
MISINFTISNNFPEFLDTKEVKFFLPTPLRHIEGMEVQLHTFLIFTLIRGERLIYVLVNLPSGKIHRTNIIKCYLGHRASTDILENIKIFASAEIRLSNPYLIAI